MEMGEHYIIFGMYIVVDQVIRISEFLIELILIGEVMGLNVFVGMVGVVIFGMFVL